MLTVPGTWPGSFRKALTTNSTATSFAAKVPTTTEPVDDGVIDLGSDINSPRPAWLVLVPYAVASADNTFDMVVVGWRKISTLWVPTRLLFVTCTVGSATGVAGAAVLNTELFVDTVASAAVGVANVTYTLHSPADNTIAHIRLQTEGCQKVEFLFDITLSTTSMNCLVATI